MAHDDVLPDLTTDEVARALRLNRATVQRMLLSGRLRGYQIGRSWRVPRSALEEFRQVVREEAAAPYGEQPVRPPTMASRKEWLRTFEALGGSIAVRPPASDSLRREDLYGDRS